MENTPECKTAADLLPNDDVFVLPDEYYICQDKCGPHKFQSQKFYEIWACEASCAALVD